MEAGEARIGIFLRLRPPRRSAGRVVAATEGDWVEFSVPKDAAQGFINNSKESYKFQFDGVFAPEAQQDAVFEAIARPAIAAALEGINGTIFCYGQTGSGKTFTVTGGTERYADRGLIPRALAAVFAEAQARSSHSYSITVSYLELYNEEGFDLLDPSREVRRMEDLPKVFVMEDDDGRMHVRNLSAHRTSNEEEALNLLFLGDTNRMVAETPLNQASSRSHAIFTIQIEARKAGDDRVRRSKLNFVDLAGSERVTKTGIEGTILKEAKFINLSLHYLEQVIVALQERRPHIPYRNSLLTQMLRDSLGGNCRTVMVANVAPETQHVEESISTCRFAQRVAMISNKVTVNEEVDPALVIKRLKQENLQLRQELQLLKGGSGAAGSTASSEGAGEGDPAAAPPPPPQQQQLGEEEQARLRRRVWAFVEDAAPDATLDVEASMLNIRAVFSIFKSMVREGRKGRPARAVPGEGPLLLQDVAAGDGGSADASGAGSPGQLEQPDLASEVESLRSTLQRKEKEVALLVGMLRKQGAADPLAAAASAASPGLQKLPPADTLRPGSAAGSAAQEQPPAASTVAPFDDGLLGDKDRAFEYFCSSSPTHDAILGHKALLRSKYEEAKGLGAQVNASKQRLGELKSWVEQRRVQRSMAALMQGQQAPEGEDPEEERALALISQEKGSYREALGQLKGLKSEIDQLQALLDHTRGRLQREFQAWFGLMLGQAAPEQRQRIQQQLQQKAQGQGQGQEQLQEQWRQQQQQEQLQGGGWSIAAGQGAVPAAAAGSAFTELGSRGEGGAALQLQAGGVAAMDVMAKPPAGLAPQSTAPLQQQRQQQQQQQQLGGLAVPQPRPASRQVELGSSARTSSFGGQLSPAAAWPAAAVSPGGQQQPVLGAQGQTRPGTPAGLAPRGQAAPAPPSSDGVGGRAALPAVGTSAAGAWGTAGQGPAAGPALVAPAAAVAVQPVAPPAAQAEFAGVDPEVLAAARPLLTGNPAADVDIIRFYQARAALLNMHVRAQR